MKEHTYLTIPLTSIIAVLIFLFSAPKALSGQSSLSSYGSVFVKTSKIHNQYRPQIGGMGGIVFNHHIGLVAYGNGQLGSVNLSTNDAGGANEQDLSMKFGYGGLFAEYFFINNKFLRFSLPLKVGYGAVGIYDNTTEERIEKSRLLVLEPELHFDVRLGNHVAISLQASYRFGNIKDLTNISNQTLSGLNLGLGLKMTSK
ncbi:MAG TPA: hypothetical protein ENK75_05745 [Saprospiraceae bacterium]|nr:hypothetical protein [Saprospiraceae bacterium]